MFRLSKLKNKVLGTNSIIFVYILIVVFSKIVRYTVMKASLVDLARGDDILNQMLYDSKLRFMFSTIDSNIAFNNAAAIYKVINIFNLTTYIQFEVYITIVWNIMVILILLKLDKLKNNIQSIYLILTIAVLNIFNFTIAKEPIQILYFFLIYFILNQKIPVKFKFVLSIGVIIFSTLTFRNYYILFAFFSCISYFLLNYALKKIKKVTKNYIVICFVLIIISIFLFLVIAEKMSPRGYRELLKVRTRSSSKAATKIKTIIPKSTSNKYKYIIEYVIIIFRMLFPIELFAKGPKYILFIIYQIIITYQMIICIKNYKTNNEITNLALCLYIGFILVSATFEPDFGSWIRHEAVAFPIFMIIMGIDRKKIKTGSTSYDKQISTKI